MNPPAVETKSTSNRSDLPDDTDYEVVVIGAGVGGIYQIKRLVDLGVSATVLEGDSDLGGTWYRNGIPERDSTQRVSHMVIPGIRKS